MKDPYNHIEQYLQGLLPAEERQAFEQAMQTDKDLQSAVEHYTQLSPLVDLMMEEHIRAGLDQIKRHPGTSGRIWKIVTYAAAAVVLLLAVFWLLIDRVDGPSLYAEYYRYPLLEDVRGELEEDETSESWYFQAHDLLREKKTEEAEEIFSRLIAQNGDYREEAEWFLVMVALKVDDVPLARQRLKPILQSETHLYRERAQQLQKDLD